MSDDIVSDNLHAVSTYPAIQIPFLSVLSLILTCKMLNEAYREGM